MKNTNKIKIPFKVSARTARLIGRENIATSKGAIIELVKNSYDADSNFCIVYFDNLYSTVHKEITVEYYLELLNKNIPDNLLTSVYEKNGDTYSLKSDISEKVYLEFKKLISKFSALYIIDVGEGMTQEIIKNHWMIIGTDNKASNFVTKTGRIKAGAKGIGRFALDKLGGKCEMTTFFNPSYHDIDIDEDGKKTDFNGYKWIVNWEDFEGDFKTIDKVNADLIGLKEETLLEYINMVLPKNILSELKHKYVSEFGTILKITDLRDDWEDYYVDQVFSDLEILVPPKEAEEFEIYLFSSLTPEKYGEILGSICDDYDYKIIAKADEKQNVKIKVIRKEYDLDIIPSEFFKRPNMMKEPYTIEAFNKGYWMINKTFSQLLPGFAGKDEDKVFNDIGVFEFTFYFLKKTYTSIDANRFFYKKFMSNSRKDWLDKFGGIKLFRDNFRVRPYGEVNNVAFDWLGLGNRKATSPAGVAKEGGGYRVEPESVTGAIKISRLTNVNFEDKSSREGLQENKTFQIFKTLITSIIGVFESDRSYIAREMAAFDDERFSEMRSRQEAEKIAKQIIQDSRNRKKSKPNNATSNQSNSEDVKDQQLTIIAELNEIKDEEIERLKEEQKVLRGLASSGIVLASFSHDLNNLKGQFGSRIDKLRDIISEKIDENEFSEADRRKNPFAELEKMKKQDIKLKNWLNFSIGAARKDKRKRRQLFLTRYFNDFKNNWISVLEHRAIDLDITKIENLDLRVFEIDFDSIFNNLLVNSVEAFKISKENRERQIIIKAYTNSREIVIDYNDNGSGLSSDIDNPEVIFEPLFTTNRNPFTGEEKGTGLGMWIVKSIVEENDGIVKLLYPKEGFGIRLLFPLKYKR